MDVRADSRLGHRKPQSNKRGPSSVFSAPSVTLWPNQKIENFTRRNFFGFCRNSPMSRRRSPVSPVRLS